MAAHQVPRTRWQEFGSLGLAALGTHAIGVDAPRAEDASGRRTNERWRIARDRIESLIGIAIESRDGGEQAERIGHLRAVEDLVTGGGFDD